LGAVLYELLAGRPPFTGESSVALAFQHLESAPPPLRTARPDMPPALDDIVRRCLAKKPRRRYQSAGRLAADLRQAASGGVAGMPPHVEPHVPHTDTPVLLPAPVTPIDPSPDRATRARRRLRRRTKVFAALTMVAVAMAGAGGLLLTRGSPPATASTRPPPVLHGPVGMAAKGGCDGFFKGKVTLTWAATRSRFADGYVVYRRAAPAEPWTKLELLPGRFTTSFVDHGLNTSTTFSYLVRATSGSRISGEAATARAETPTICF
jgi:serine/threonine-protein kinase